MSDQKNNKSPIFRKLATKEKNPTTATYMIYQKVEIVNGRPKYTHSMVKPKSETIVVNYRVITKKETNERVEIYSILDDVIRKNIAVWVLDKFSDYIKAKWGIDKFSEVKVGVVFTDKSNEVVQRELQPYIKENKATDVDIHIDNSEKNVKIKLHSLYMDLADKNNQKASIKIHIGNVSSVTCKEYNKEVEILEEYVDIDI